MARAIKVLPPPDPNPYFVKHLTIHRVPSGRAIRGAPLVGRPDARAVHGSAAFDHITGWNGDDYYLDGGGGDDTIDGKEGNDWINGGAGNDILYGGDDHDILYGGRGQDILDGGAGNDFLRARRFSQDLGRYEFRSGVFYNFDGDNHLRGGSGHDILEGGFGNDRLYGDDERNAALSGNDSLIGWSGDDWLEGGSGNDLIYGDYGKAYYEGLDVQTRKRFFFFSRWSIPAYEDDGYRANGVRIRTYGHDTLIGGAGDDKLYGEDGNDRLIGGAGRDHLEGGKGNDIYIIADSSDRSDKIVERANEGTDTIETSVTHALRSRVNDQVENLTLKGTRAINGTGNHLNNVIRGNSASNRLIGSSGNDTLRGGSGNDELVGTNPYRMGTPRNEIDVLTGGGGRDRFVLGIGGPNSQNRIGGAHSQYLYDDGTRRSPGTTSYGLITDFTNGVDKIQLKGRMQEYVLKSIRVSHGGRTISGTGIYLDEYSTFPDELIGFVQHGQGIRARQLNLTNRAQFVYV